MLKKLRANCCFLAAIAGVYPSVVSYALVNEQSKNEEIRDCQDVSNENVSTQNVSKNLSKYSLKRLICSVPVLIWGSAAAIAAAATAAAAVLVKNMFVDAGNSHGHGIDQHVTEESDTAPPGSERRLTISTVGTNNLIKSAYDRLHENKVNEDTGNNHKSKNPNTAPPGSERRLTISTVGTNNLIKSAYDRLSEKDGQEHEKDDYVPGGKYDRKFHEMKILTKVIQNMVEDAKKDENYETIKKLVLENKKIPKDKFTFNEEDVAYYMISPRRACYSKNYPLDVRGITEDYIIGPEEAWRELHYVYFRKGVFQTQKEKSPGDYEKIVQQLLKCSDHEEDAELFFADIENLNDEGVCRDGTTPVLYFKEPMHGDGRLNPKFDRSDYSLSRTKEYKYAIPLSNLFDFDDPRTFPLGIQIKLFEHFRKIAQDKDRKLKKSPLCQIYSTRDCHPNYSRLLWYYFDNYHKKYGYKEGGKYIGERLFSDLSKHAQYLNIAEVSLGNNNFIVDDAYPRYSTTKEVGQCWRTFFNYPKQAIHYFSRHLKKGQENKKQEKGFLDKMTEFFKGFK